MSMSFTVQFCSKFASCHKRRSYGTGSGVAGLRRPSLPFGAVYLIDASRLLATAEQATGRWVKGK